jgi:hypothetical protein
MQELPVDLVRFWGLLTEKLLILPQQILLGIAVQAHPVVEERFQPLF